MVPISTLRETIVLVIFGIVLVPIAAKRAQDAPGYWKAFAANAHHALVYYDPQPPTPDFVLSISCGGAMSSSRPTNPYTVVGTTRKPETCASHSLTRPQRDGSTSVGPMTLESREVKGRLTLRSPVFKSKPATHAVMTEAVAEAAKASTGAVPTAVDGAISPTVTTTSAANRERWTLIWMGTAITVVAVLMSFC